MTDRLYLWVSYHQVARHLAEGWQLGRAHESEWWDQATGHARYSVMMWRNDSDRCSIPPLDAAADVTAE